MLPSTNLTDEKCHPQKYVYQNSDHWGAFTTDLQPPVWTQAPTTAASQHAFPGPRACSPLHFRGDKANVAPRFQVWLTVRPKGRSECPAVRHLGCKHRPRGHSECPAVRHLGCKHRPGASGTPGTMSQVGQGRKPQPLRQKGTRQGTGFSLAEVTWGGRGW